MAYTGDATGHWIFELSSAKDTKDGVVISFANGPNRVNDDERVNRGSYRDERNGLEFEFDYIENLVGHGHPGEPGYWGVKTGYVFADLIWWAYRDACGKSRIAGSARKTPGRLMAEFAAAFDAWAEGGGLYRHWLRGWRLIVLDSEGYVSDPPPYFSFDPFASPWPGKTLHPSIDIEKFERRFEADYEVLVDDPACRYVDDSGPADLTTRWSAAQALLKAGAGRNWAYAKRPFFSLAEGAINLRDRTLKIRFRVRPNPAMKDSRVWRGYYQHDVSRREVGFAFDYIEHIAGPDGLHAQGYGAVSMGYVFLDRIEKAYRDAYWRNELPPFRAKSVDVLMMEFIGAFEAFGFAAGMHAWLRDWQLAFLTSDGLVVDPAPRAEFSRSALRNERFPVIDMEKLADRFEMDGEALLAGPGRGEGWGAWFETETEFNEQAKVG